MTKSLLEPLKKDKDPLDLLKPVNDPRANYIIACMKADRLHNEAAFLNEQVIKPLMYRLNPMELKIKVYKLHQEADLLRIGAAREYFKIK